MPKAVRQARFLVPPELHTLRSLWSGAPRKVLPMDLLGLLRVVKARVALHLVDVTGSYHTVGPMIGQTLQGARYIVRDSGLDLEARNPECLPWREPIAQGGDEVPPALFELQDVFSRDGETAEEIDLRGLIDEVKAAAIVRIIQIGGTVSSVEELAGLSGPGAILLLRRHGIEAHAMRHGLLGKGKPVALRRVPRELVNLARLWTNGARHVRGMDVHEAIAALRVEAVARLTEITGSIDGAARLSKIPKGRAVSILAAHAGDVGLSVHRPMSTPVRDGEVPGEIATLERLWLHEPSALRPVDLERVLTRLERLAAARIS